MSKSSGYVRSIIRPREIDLGSVVVHRCLPARGVEAVGPWVFFDHIGPASFAPGKGIDVIPHPHINLATITYLFEGELVHRDSIGTVQTITPGAINLMVAGRGIVHSERTGPPLRATGHRMNGLQLWAALPQQHEEIEPAFYHYPASDLPVATIGGVRVRVMIGAAYGMRAPVVTLSATLYVEAELPAGKVLRLPDESGERAVYTVSGGVRVQDTTLPERALAVLGDAPGVELFADADSRIAVIGGAPLGKRIMWWNFVSSKKERIEKAKADWKENRFPRVPGETEASPLPGFDAFFERAQR